MMAVWVNAGALFLVLLTGVAYSFPAKPGFDPSSSSSGGYGTYPTSGGSTSGVMYAPAVSGSGTASEVVTYPASYPAGQPSYPASYPAGQPSYPASNPSGQPSYPASYPSGQPSYPASYPSGQPSYPASYPSGQPSNPASYPSGQPSYPASSPASYPSGQPSYPASSPASYPSGQPSYPASSPASYPSGQPSYPASSPASYPSGQPSYPASNPASYPSGQPSYPASNPASYPSGQPSYPASSPASYPSGQPSYPASSPASYPSGQPSYPSGEPSYPQPSVQRQPAASYSSNSYAAAPVASGYAGGSSAGSTGPSTAQPTFSRDVDWAVAPPSPLSGDGASAGPSAGQFSGPSNVSPPRPPQLQGGELNKYSQIVEYGDSDSETEEQGFLPGPPPPGAPALSGEGSPRDVQPSGPDSSSLQSLYPYPNAYQFLTGQYPPGTITHSSSSFEQGADNYQDTHYIRYYYPASPATQQVQVSPPAFEVPQSVKQPRQPVKQSVGSASYDPSGAATGYNRPSGAAGGYSAYKGN